MGSPELWIIHLNVHEDVRSLEQDSGFAQEMPEQWWGCAHSVPESIITKSWSYVLVHQHLPFQPLGCMIYYHHHHHHLHHHYQHHHRLPLIDVTKVKILHPGKQNSASAKTEFHNLTKMIQMWIFPMLFPLIPLVLEKGNELQRELNSRPPNTGKLPPLASVISAVIALPPTFIQVLIPYFSPPKDPQGLKIKPIKQRCSSQT